MEYTQKIFSALVNNNEEAAHEAFENAISAKLQTALDVKKVAVASQLFNKEEE